MDLGWLFPALWALGWFVTFALAVAYGFATNFKDLRGSDGRLDNEPVAGSITLGPIFTALFWPLLLTGFVGWLFCPIMKRLLDFRERQRRQ